MTEECLITTDTLPTTLSTIIPSYGLEFNDVFNELDNNFIINTLKELRKETENQLLLIQNDEGREGDSPDDMMALIEDLPATKDIVLGNSDIVNNKRPPDSPQSPGKRPLLTPHTPRSISYRGGVLGYNINIDEVAFNADSIVPPGTKPLPFNKRTLLGHRQKGWKDGAIPRNCTVCDKYLGGTKRALKVAHMGEHVKESGKCPVCEIGMEGSEGITAHLLTHEVKGSTLITELVTYIVGKEAFNKDKESSEALNKIVDFIIKDSTYQKLVNALDKIEEQPTEKLKDFLTKPGDLQTCQDPQDPQGDSLLVPLGLGDQTCDILKNVLINHVSSTPACVSTIPIAKFKYAGDSQDTLIMEGIVHTGSTQTNCFLIPISLSTEDIQSLGTDNDSKEDATSIIADKISKAISIISGGVNQPNLDKLTNQSVVNISCDLSPPITEEGTYLTEALEKLSNEELLQLLHNCTQPSDGYQEEEEEEGRATCSLCVKEFNSATELNTHMSTHLITHRYSCYECGFGTSTVEQLLLHKAGHGGELEALHSLDNSEGTAPGPSSSYDTPLGYRKCYICNGVIKEDKFSVHLIHHRQQLTAKAHKKTILQKSSLCTLCGGIIGEKEQLSTHLASHVTSKGYKCAHCDLPFTQLNQLRKHTTINHSDPSKKTYQCCLCSSKFSGTYHLKRHIKTMHENKRDYKCSECSKSFVEQHCLKRHIRNVHNNVRDHTCPICSRGFTYRQDMFRHIMSVHQKIRDVTCPICNKSFYHRYFINHALRVHDLTVKQRDGIFYVYDEQGRVVHKIS